MLNSRYHATINFCIALVADLFLLVAVVEGIHHWKKPFTGFFQIVSIEQLRIGFYIVALSQIVMIRWLANLPLKKTEIDDENEALSRLQISSFIVYLLVELIAVMGLILFIMQGLRLDFYVFLGLAFFYLAIYFPKKKDWTEWVETLNI